jgi:hypothetical protein
MIGGKKMNYAITNTLDEALNLTIKAYEIFSEEQITDSLSKFDEEVRTLLFLESVNSRNLDVAEKIRRNIFCN